MFDVETCISFITNRSSKIMADAFNERLMSKGVTRVQWLALYFLGQEEPMSQSELAEKMGIKGSTVTRLIDRLEREGYVVRQKEPDDRRVTMIVLTDKGSQFREELLPEGEEMSQIFARDIPPEDIEVFKRVLDKMINNVK